MRRRISFDSLNQDIRFAMRTLARSKAWTGVAVLTLALGIGANTAVFSVVNDLLLDPLKYPDSDRIVLVSRSSQKLQTVPTFEQLAAFRKAKTLEGLEGFESERQTLIAGSNEPRMSHVAGVSSTFAKFAGARVLQGRFFLSEDEKAAAAPVALISEHVWRATFGASLNAVGQTISLDGKAHTVIGVLKDGVRVPAYITDDVDIWTNLTIDPSHPNGFLGGPALARLAKDASTEQAHAELENILRSIDTDPKAVNALKFTVQLSRPGASGNARDSVMLLAGAVCLLLLIACANVAHLLLARGASRERELSIRAALGAGGGRIVRQLITESLILSSAGCIVGLILGQLALRAIIAVRPPNFADLEHVQINGRVLMVTIGLSVVSGLCFGLIAGFSGKRGGNFDTLRSSAGSTLNRGRNRFRSLLVVTENALSVVLLIGAIMLIRTVINLHAFDPGFDAKGVFAQRVTLPAFRYKDVSARQAYVDELLRGARAIPGVESATIATSAPGQTGAMVGHWIAEGESPSAVKPDGMEFTVVNSVRPEYFALMRMPLMSGRTFSANAAADNELIISESMARKVWNDTNVVGRRLRMESRVAENGSPVWSTVVGVTPNTSAMSLIDRGSTQMVYFPMDKPDERIALLVRTKGTNAPVAELRRLFLSVDPSMSPPEAMSCADLLLQTAAMQKFLMTLLTLFAALAVILSAIGLYGVITYMVSQSTREIGVRVALGAASRDVVRLVMQKGVTLSLLGLGIGLIAAIWSTKLLGYLLFGMTAADPISFTFGALLLLIVAVGACVAPTVRALRIDPMLAMRSD